MFEDTQESYPDDESEKQLKFYYNRKKELQMLLKLCRIIIMAK